MSRSDYPDCPDCESDIFVDAQAKADRFRCHHCDGTFLARLGQ